MKTVTMEVGDLEEVTALAAQLGYPNSIEDIRVRFARIRNAPGYGLFVAKSENGQVLGYIQINSEPETLLAGPRADVAALVVDEAARRAGIGVALLRRAEKWAREQRLTTIRVRSNITRNDAH